jgi:hypothetical protein
MEVIIVNLNKQQFDKIQEDAISSLKENFEKTLDDYISKIKEVQVETDELEFEKGDIVKVWNDSAKKHVAIYSKKARDGHACYRDGQHKGDVYYWNNCELIKKAKPKNKLVITMDNDDGGDNYIGIFINPEGLTKYNEKVYRCNSSIFCKCLDRCYEYIKIQDNFNLKPGMKLEFDL